MINVIAIGTESGTIDKAMTSLARYYSRQASIQETTKSAVLYPSILITMMIAVLFFLSSNVLPVFENVLQSLGASLSPVANAIMIGSKFVSKFSIVIIFAVALLLFYFTKSRNGKAKLINWLWQTKIFETLSVSILAASMSTTLSSGLDTDRSLELSATSINNNKVNQKIQKCLNLLRQEHMPFIKALEQCELFSGISSNILNTGIRTGSLDEAMKYVADI